MKPIEEFLNTSERVLNPGTNGEASPCYEVQNSVDSIKQLETAFTT